MIIPCSSEEPAFLRYGNFCYAGVIDVRQARGELDRVPSVIQAVHRQQGSLPFLCRSSDLPEMWRSKLGAIRAASEFVLEQLSSGDGGGKLVERRAAKQASRSAQLGSAAESAGGDGPGTTGLSDAQFAGLFGKELSTRQCGGKCA